MKRRDILKSGLVVAAGSALAAPALAQSAPSIRWRMTSSFPKSLETIYGGGEFFAERVNKLTDGKFHIPCSPRAISCPHFRRWMPSSKAPSRSATPPPITTSERTPRSASVPRCPSASTSQQNAWLYHAGGNER